MIEIHAKVAEVNFEPQGIYYFLCEFGKDNGTGMGVLHCKELEEGADEDGLSESFRKGQPIHYWCDKYDEVRSIDYTEFVMLFTKMVNEDPEKYWDLFNFSESDLLDLHNDFLDMLEEVLYNVF